MIEVDNLVKRYGEHLAVDHLSFQIEHGKIYGFLGPNGAGKSTTMNIMTGYIAATAGSVKIDGYDIVRDAEEAKKCIGYLPEIPPLYADMTVDEYLLFAAELKKLPIKERKKQVEEVETLAMLGDVRGRLIKNLSKGYKQRVGLAQAVLGYPEVIILDEPTVGLDPKQIIEMRDLIKKLGEQHTVLLSSHILSEVQAVCDEIMILSHGRLVASGTPDELTERMSGNSRIELVVKGEKNRLADALGALKGAVSYQIEETEEAGFVSAVIETERGTDIREELFYTLVDGQLPIMSLTRAEESLEDIFLSLTAEEQQGVEEESDESNL